MNLKGKSYLPGFKLIKVELIFNIFVENDESFHKNFHCFIFRFGMKILVVAAMPSELKVIKEWVKSAKLKMNLNIDYLCCGIGNYETISSLEHYLTQNPEPIFIWNIWICGYRNQNKEKKSDPFQVTSVINIHTEKELIIPPFLQLAPMRNCFCSEKIVLEKPNFQSEILLINDEMYFDM